jgi:hypothetical protein
MISRTGAFGNYSYKLKIDADNTLYFGLALGILDTKIDFSKAVIRDADDPMLFQTAQNKTVFSADFGMLYLWKKLTVGFAVPQILGNQIKYGFPDGTDSYYNLSRHYQGSVKYVFDVVKEKGITAYPLIMLRTVAGAPVQYDINTVVDWKKIGWAALTYHSNYAIAISAGVRYQNFSIGYAYDIGVSKIRTYTGSSSEFLLGYIFGNNKKETKGYVKTEEPIKDTSKVIVKAKTDTTKSVLGAPPSADSLKRNAAGTGNEALVGQMKNISDRYYEVVNQVDEALLTQMKAVSDSNQAQMTRLKAELAVIKTTGINSTPADSSKRTVSKSESDILRSQFKSKSDSNQVQINQLKSRLATIEASKTLDNLIHSSSSTDDVLLAKLKSKTDSNQIQIDRLKAEIAKLKSTTTTSGNIIPQKTEVAKTTGAIVTNPNPAGGIIRTSESDDFADDKGKPVSKGFYVVVGTFGNKDNAEKFKATNIIKGHVNSKIIQNHFTKVYNIYVLKANNKADADAERAKYKVEYPDVWILNLE